MSAFEDILVLRGEMEELDRKYPPLAYHCSDDLVERGSMMSFYNPLDGKKHVIFHSGDYATLHYEMLKRAVAEGESTIIGLRWYYEEEARKLSAAYWKYAERKYSEEETDDQGPEQPLR